MSVPSKFLMNTRTALASDLAEFLRAGWSPSNPGSLQLYHLRIPQRALPKTLLREDKYAAPSSAGITFASRKTKEGRIFLVSLFTGRYMHYNMRLN